MFSVAKKYFHRITEKHHLQNDSKLEDLNILKRIFFLNDFEFEKIKTVFLCFQWQKIVLFKQKLEKHSLIIRFA